MLLNLFHAGSAEEACQPILAVGWGFVRCCAGALRHVATALATIEAPHPFLLFHPSAVDQFRSSLKLFSLLSTTFTQKQHADKNKHILHTRIHTHHPYASTPHASTSRHFDTSTPRQTTSREDLPTITTRKACPVHMRMPTSPFGAS